MQKKYENNTGLEIQAHLLSQLGIATGLPVGSIGEHEAIADLGIDSIIAAELNVQIEKELGVGLPFSQIAEGASVRDVAHFLYQQLQVNNGDIAANIICDQKSEDFFDIKSLPQYRNVKLQKEAFKLAQIESPYFRSFNTPSTETLEFNNKQLVNFATYNYLGYNNHPYVNAAAQDAITQYGTSVSSSRLVSGEKNIHGKLESSLAELYNVDDALVFVSGYVTNITVISHLMGENDLIIHDSLAHNSIVMGSEFSKAKRFSFPHNNTEALDSILKENRHLYEKVLIVTEGLFSMDGDTAPLATLVEIKKRHKCLLMVDEAHSIGVLGANGLGLREHCNVEATDVDIWMGTLSKSFAGCGGYIAGCKELIEYLKFSTPGFIFSVGLAPPLAGASLAAIELLKSDNSRVKKLQENSQYFLFLAEEKGLDTGLAEGYAIIPIILRRSLAAIAWANKLFSYDIITQAIIYPAVEEQAARLRFFISALHTEQQIKQVIKRLDTLKE